MDCIKMRKNGRKTVSLCGRTGHLCPPGADTLSDIRFSCADESGADLHLSALLAVRETGPADRRGTAGAGPAGEIAFGAGQIFQGALCTLGTGAKVPDTEQPVGEGVKRQMPVWQASARICRTILSAKIFRIRLQMPGNSSRKSALTKT